MYIKVKLYGTLRRLATDGIWVGDIPDDSTVRDLIKLVGSSESEVAVITINGKAIGLDEKIPNGCEIVMVTPVGGG